MFERMSRGWRLAMQALEVLKADKELLLFPLLSGIACILVLGSFAVPMLFTGFFEKEQHNALSIVILYLFYAANYFVIVFFNSALIACAIIRFKGGNPTLKDGFSAAFSRMPQILGWALVAATVGLILKIIEERSERFGEIVAGLLGMAWSAVTFFVVPVIVVEKTGPIDAAKRSFAILKRTWGEALTANFGIGMIVFLANLAGIIPLVLGIMLVANGMTSLGALLIVAGIVVMLIVSLISSALTSIVNAGLYLYAKEGTVGSHFDDNLFREAFAHK